jgi:hypothetical protein
MLSAIDIDRLEGQKSASEDARKKTLPTKSAPVSSRFNFCRAQGWRSVEIPECACSRLYFEFAA